MVPRHNERVSSDFVRADALVDVYSGQCPLCGRPAVWAFSGRESPERVLLVPGSGFRLSVGSGRTVVVVSAAGRLLVAESWVYQLHVCDPGAITSEIGAYSSVVLAHPCPVESCSAPPGEMCVSPRYEVLPRPHGARVASSTDRAWSDEEELGSTSLDE